MSVKTDFGKIQTIITHEKNPNFNLKKNHSSPLKSGKYQTKLKKKMDSDTKMARVIWWRLENRCGGKSVPINQSSKKRRGRKKKFNRKVEKVMDTFLHVWGSYGCEICMSKATCHQGNPNWKNGGQSSSYQKGCPETASLDSGEAAHTHVKHMSSV